jgi:hypothetical protein
MRKQAWAVDSSKYGGLPETNSIAVQPKLQISEAGVAYQTNYKSKQNKQKNAYFEQGDHFGGHPIGGANLFVHSVLQERFVGPERL